MGIAWSNVTTPATFAMSIANSSLKDEAINFTAKPITAEAGYMFVIPQNIYNRTADKPKMMVEVEVKKIGSASSVVDDFEIDLSTITNLHFVAGQAVNFKIIWSDENVIIEVLLVDPGKDDDMGSPIS